MHYCASGDYEVACCDLLWRRCCPSRGAGMRPLLPPRAPILGVRKTKTQLGCGGTRIRPRLQSPRLLRCGKRSETRASDVLTHLRFLVNSLKQKGQRQETHGPSGSTRLKSHSGVSIQQSWRSATRLSLSSRCSTTSGLSTRGFAHHIPHKYSPTLRRCFEAWPRKRCLQSAAA